MKYKQCKIQFDNGSYLQLWLPTIDAKKDNVVYIDDKQFNIKGKATVLEVYNSIEINKQTTKNRG